jgi:hypothetical protein
VTPVAESLHRGLRRSIRDCGCGDRSFFGDLIGSGCGRGNRERQGESEQEGFCGHADSLRAETARSTRKTAISDLGLQQGDTITFYAGPPVVEVITYAPPVTRPSLRPHFIRHSEIRNSSFPMAAAAAHRCSLSTRRPQPRGNRVDRQQHLREHRFRIRLTFRRY